MWSGKLVRVGVASFIVGALCGCARKEQSAEVGPEASVAPSAAAPAVAAPPAQAPRAASSEPKLVEACSVKITGDTSLEIAGMVSLNPRERPNVKTSLATQHWMTAAQLQSADDAARRALGSKSGSGGSLIPPLLLNCGNETASLSLVASGDLTAADIPMSPATYDIGSFRKARAGKGFTVLMHLSDGEVYEAGAGKLVLTIFDKKRLAGTFSFPAQGRLKKKKLQIEGKFDFPCESNVCS